MGSGCGGATHLDATAESPTEAAARFAARVAAGGAEVHADEWLRVYQDWASRRAPRLAVERDTPLPSAAERDGPRTVYKMPGGVQREHGRPHRSDSMAGTAALAALRRQSWGISADGMRLVGDGAELTDASVIVQLFAQALPRVLEAHRRDEERRQKRLEQRVRAALAAGEEPPTSVPLTKEEKTYRGGPGYCVELANAQLRQMLEYEQSLTAPLTLAAVGDGSWDPRLRSADPGSASVSRAALLHDGTVLGGAIANDVGMIGHAHNYDGELAPRLDVLAHSSGQRLLYVFDSTSPVEASEHFRACSTRARMKFECDGELGTCLALENEQELIVYWWLHSHCGHMLERAVDESAKEFLKDEGSITAVPYRISRHVSIRGLAKCSERRAMQWCLNANVAAHMVLTSPRVVRASPKQLDALVHARVSAATCRVIYRARHNRVGVTHSAAYASLASAPWADLRVYTARCSCGSMEHQSADHVLWRCTHAPLVEIREGSLADAVGEWRVSMAALDANKGAARSGVHAQLQACDNQLHAFQGMDGDRSSTNSMSRALLGVVDAPGLRGGLPAALRKATAALDAVARMLSWAEREARPRIFQMVTDLRLRQACQGAFSWWRLRNAWHAGRASGAGDAGGLHWRAGAAPFTRRVLDTAASMVRRGEVEQGSWLYQFSCVLTMRARHLLATWRVACSWSHVYLARVTLEAQPQRAAEVRRRRDVQERARTGTGQPTGMAHLRARPYTSSMRRAVDELRVGGELRLRAAQEDQACARARMEDARRLEELAAVWLEGSSAWMAHFHSAATRAASRPARASAACASRAVKAATPQTERSVVHARSLTLHQAAVARVVITPRRVDPSVPAAVVAARNIVERTGNVDVRDAAATSTPAAGSGGGTARVLFGEATCGSTEERPGSGGVASGGGVLTARLSRPGASSGGRGRQGASRRGGGVRQGGGGVGSIADAACARGAGHSDDAAVTAGAPQETARATRKRWREGPTEVQGGAGGEAGAVHPRRSPRLMTLSGSGGGGTSMATRLT